MIRCGPTDSLLKAPPPPSVTEKGENGLADLALKWACNAITTGAMVRKGAVYGNKLVCMTLANDKIFTRGERIVQNVAGVPPTVAYRALLRAAHRVDDPAELDKLLRCPEKSTHIKAAIQTSNCLPMGILLALKPSLTCDEAEAALAAEPILREALRAADAKAA